MSDLSLYVCVWVCTCTVNSLSCQIPLGEFEQIVFSIWWKYSGYRYRELASVEMTSKVLEVPSNLAFAGFWCGSRVWTQVRPRTFCCPPVCFLHPPPPHEKQRKCRGRRKDFSLGVLWLLRQHRGQAADEPCPMYKSVKMLLPVIASLFNLSHSSGLTRLFRIARMD